MNIDIKKLIPDRPRVLVQGITGREGTRAIPTMLGYGTNVIAGVTPGKGGGTVFGVPVFNTIAEALAVTEQINMIVQFVPPLQVLSATREALDGGVPLLLVGAEKVPIQDEITMRALASESGSVLIGPGSVGMIVPRIKLKLGMIGGATPERAFVSGNIAVLSKSGGMTSEISLHLKKNGLGVSIAVGIGGERVIASDFAEISEALEHDDNTKAIVIFGEPGGGEEERLARAVKTGRVTKPVVAFIVGDCASILPKEAQFGHIGAILYHKNSGAKEKRAILKDAGVLVAERFDDIALILKKVIT